MLNLLSIKEQPLQPNSIDEETIRFREDWEINKQINKILNSDIPDWETSDLLTGLEMMQELYLGRLDLPELYNKGVKTAINRIINALQSRNVTFELRVKSLLPTS